MSILVRWGWHIAGICFVLILGYWYGTTGWKHYKLETSIQSARAAAAAAGAKPPPRISTLILDLDGDGVEHYGLSTSNAFFDLDADGFAEKTGWVGTDDALLGRDLNGNGKIDDINDLFGGENTNGFEQLASLDNNNDGVINSRDNVFASLLLWRDEDQDGITDKGELKTLSDHGINSISLTRNVVNSIENGNYVSDSSSFSYMDTTTSVIENVGFENDQLNTDYIGAYRISLSPFNKTSLRGYGEVVDLRVAMTYDPLLKEMIGELIWSDYTGQEYKSDIRDIFLRWTGSDKIRSGSRGKNVDAKELNALEKYLAINADARPDKRRGQALTTVFNDFVEYLTVKFLVQGPLKEIFSGIAYNPEQDRFEGSTDFTGAIQSLAAFAPTNATEAKYFWLCAIKMVDYLSIDMGLVVTEHDSVFSRILRSTDVDLDMAELRSFNLIVGSVKDDTLFAFYDKSAFVFGGAGNDYIIGSKQTDKLFGGGGNDIIEAQAGDDIVDGGAGNDTVLIEGIRANYDIYEVRGETVVEELIGSEDLKRLSNVEKLVFFGAAGKADDVTVDLVKKTAPVAGSASFSTSANTPILIPVSELIKNAIDRDGDALSLSSIDNAENGLIGLYGNGQVAFIPDPEFSGKASFEYTVIDSSGLTSTGIATVRVVKK